jgi:hypothetical protein
MARVSWPFLGALIAVTLVVAVVLFSPWVGPGRPPQPVAAWVGVEAQGSGVARVGRLELPAGEPFDLHAVLEARDRRGDAVYFTQAPALEIAGRRVPAEALRRWPEGRRVRVLWFTIEGFGPYLAVREAADLERFTVEELFRPDWPQAWSIRGALDPRHDDHLMRELDRLPREFGIQRFHVRIELFASDLALVPAERFRSPGAVELMAGGESVATVVLALPPPLQAVSSAFGLTQLDVPEPLPEELEARVAELDRRQLAFRHELVIARHLEANERSAATLAWREALLGGGQGPRWRVEVLPGDLLRVGERMVVLYGERGAPGAVLDLEDLALDFTRGAVLGPLSAFFAGPGLVEWAPVAPRP